MMAGSGVWCEIYFDDKLLVDEVGSPTDTEELEEDVGLTEVLGQYQSTTLDICVQ
jgi:hypothetical protein